MELAWTRRPAGFRAVGLFWTGLLSVAAIGALTLQLLGPPSDKPVATAESAAAIAPESPAHAPHAPPAHVATAPIIAPHAASANEPAPAAAAASPTAPNAAASVAATGMLRPGRDAGGNPPGPIPPPDQALQESSKDYTGRSLPRIAADGRMPSQVYARGFTASNPRPRIAIVVAGLGLNGGDSEDAIRTLPGEVTLAFSPYATRPDRLLDQARAAGHEFLASVPMEPQGYPVNDAGDHALLTGASTAQNRLRLDWALTRGSGYVGATGALGPLRGERFAAAAGQMNPVLQTIADRGLLYIDPRPGQKPPPLVWGRGVDVVIDEPAVRTEIENRLAALEQIARDKGSAIGLAGAVRPVTIDRIAAWSNGLAAKGLTLAPVSALVVAPQTMDATR